jgi:hypothetical protein
MCYNNGKYDSKGAINYDTQKVLEYGLGADDGADFDAFYVLLR